MFLMNGRKDKLLRKYDISFKYIAEVAREVIKEKEVFSEVSRTQS